MNDPIIKFIFTGVGVFLAIGLIVTLVVYFNSSKETGNKSMDQLNQITTQLADTDKTVYDGSTIKGAEVIKTISRFKNELSTGVFTISVKTLSATAGKEYAAVPTAYPLKGTTDYINPNGNFVGSLTYDTNQNITGIVFTQKK